MIDVKDFLGKIYDVQEGFAVVYRNAAPFVDSGELWSFCLDTITNPERMSCIAFANEFGIPPVKSLLWFYEKDFAPADDFKFDVQTKRCLGALMVFVFKNCLGYRAQNERIQVNKFGVQTATKYLNPPAGLKIV